MQAVYAHSFSSVNKFDSQDLKKIVSHLKNIDQIIKDNAPKWPLDKINKIDFSILRTTIWELLYRPKTPPKVVIDEAVEVAKEFGAESSSSFVNGVLGSIVKNLKIKNQEKNKKDHDYQS